MSQTFLYTTRTTYLGRMSLPRCCNPRDFCLSKSREVESLMPFTAPGRPCWLVTMGRNGEGWETLGVLRAQTSIEREGVSAEWIKMRADIQVEGEALADCRRALAERVDGKVIERTISGRARTTRASSACWPGPIRRAAPPADLWVPRQGNLHGRRRCSEDIGKLFGSAWTKHTTGVIWK